MLYFNPGCSGKFIYNFELSKTTGQTEHKRMNDCYLDGRVGDLAGAAT